MKQLLVIAYYSIPLFRPNGQNLYPDLDQTDSKIISFGSTHTLCNLCSVKLHSSKLISAGSPALRSIFDVGQIRTTTIYLVCGEKATFIVNPVYRSISEPLRV